jgi:hypothetical protein
MSHFVGYFHWYVVTSDGLLERVDFVHDPEQTEVIEVYLTGGMTLTKLLERVRSDERSD